MGRVRPRVHYRPRPQLTSAFPRSLRLLRSYSSFLEMAKVPSTYSDLGKAARDLFDKGYDYPKIKLSVKTKPTESVEFEGNGHQDLEKNRTFGSLKTKVKCPYKIVLSESWNTNSELNTELTYEPKQLEGLKLLVNSRFYPNSGKKAMKGKVGYKREYVNVEGEVDMNITGPTLTGSAVFQYNGYYGGYQASYASDTGKVVGNNFSGGFEGENFTIHGGVTNLSEVLASAYQKVNDSTEVALQTTYNLQSNNVLVALGGKYTMGDGAVFRVSVFICFCCLLLFLFLFCCVVMILRGRV